MTRWAQAALGTRPNPDPNQVNRTFADAALHSCATQLHFSYAFLDRCWLGSGSGSGSGLGVGVGVGVGVGFGLGLGLGSGLGLGLGLGLGSGLGFGPRSSTSAIRLPRQVRERRRGRGLLCAGESEDARASRRALCYPRRWRDTLQLALARPARRGVFGVWGLGLGLGLALGLGLG